MTEKESILEEGTGQTDAMFLNSREMEKEREADAI